MDIKKDEIDMVSMTRASSSQDVSVILNSVETDDKMASEQVLGQICKKKRKLGEIEDIVFCGDAQHCNDYHSHHNHSCAPMMTTTTMTTMPPKKFRKEISCSNIIPSMPSSEPLPADHYILLQPSLSPQSDSTLSKGIVDTYNEIEKTKRRESTFFCCCCCLLSDGNCQHSLDTYTYTYTHCPLFIHEK
ncbi:hypothetical protein RFI_28244 [Reticulomyxa filosa]|uniref:Uncharacterized protein n=1 Tax=Reticulomyxa filosa TaxID=46433 RepID=X6M584_RETFI|nr:hypothetical protein RFI_28244 [Reticulomyxa filosa]|eukprot:ETO09143.1 hypothetical protein RFI_28244 [Reticulomyxa filosa]